jgi:hypothetical protein
VDSTTQSRDKKDIRSLSDSGCLSARLQRLPVPVRVWRRHPSAPCPARRRRAPNAPPESSAKPSWQPQTNSSSQHPICDPTGSLQSQPSWRRLTTYLRRHSRHRNSPVGSRWISPARSSPHRTARQNCWPQMTSSSDRNDPRTGLPQPLTCEPQPHRSTRHRNLTGSSPAPQAMLLWLPRRSFVPPLRRSGWILQGKALSSCFPSPPSGWTRGQRAPRTRMCPLAAPCRR